MKKQVLFIFLVSLAIVLMTACLHVQGPEMPPPEQPLPGEPLPGNPIPAEAMPDEPGPGMPEEPMISEQAPGPGYINKDALEDALDLKYAFIISMSMRMDGETDITFDPIEWLPPGPDAENQYMTDNPGATKQDMEDAGLYEVGYLRNVKVESIMLHTDSSTVYNLADPNNPVQNIPSTKTDFQNMYYPLSGGQPLVRFLKAGGVAIRIDSVYMP